MMNILLLIFQTIVLSTLLYLYLHRKTHMQRKFIFIDNLIVVAITLSIIFLFNFNHWLVFVLIPVFILGLAFAITMIRFWRTPKRTVDQDPSVLVSPADGNIIYIKQVDKEKVPISIKGGRLSELEELTKTNLLDEPCWLIGINMTPFDVHKNCAPVDGAIVLQQHTSGKFLSLKSYDSELENERNTFVIENRKIRVGIVQIASRLVRRIDAYKKQGENVKKGDWLGMIRFGSQVDLILPSSAVINVALGQQVYAGRTKMAEIKDK